MKVYDHENKKKHYCLVIKHEMFWHSRLITNLRTSLKPTTYVLYRKCTNSITSPRFVKKTTSPKLPLRCLWPSSCLGTRMGVATSKDAVSVVRPKFLEKSPCWNRLKCEWRQIETLKSCSLMGTPDVATAQQGLRTSIDPLTTVCSAPFPPTAWHYTKLFIIYKKNRWLGGSHLVLTFNIPLQSF